MRRRLGRILLLILALAVVYAIFAPPRSPEIEPGSTLVLEVEGSYVEAPRASLIARVLGEDSEPFVALLSRFAMAGRDDRLDTVVVVIRQLDIGWGKAEEIRDAIGRLRDSGRETIAYLELAAFGASREYYIATAADRVYVVPGGNVPVVGLAAEYLFLGGLWEKLGLDFEVGKAGRYKSAVESYTGKGMSPASSEMANSLLDSAFDAFVMAIAEGRGLERDAVVAAIDQGPMLPRELSRLGLIDGSEHLDEVLARTAGRVVRQEEYARVEASDVGFEPVAQVALIYGSGSVVDGRAPRGGARNPVFAAETATRAILDASEDPEIDAIVLRIDSPGGSALAAEQIWRAIQQAREAGKPIIASFSDLAASGGYYVAVAADTIVSTGGAYTGSIGVFALRPVLGGAFTKLGINVESLHRGRHADFLLAAEPLSEATHARLQGTVLATYELFLERVAAGRHLETEAVDAIAQGRVWTGRQAWEKGLVDEIGGLHTAIAQVRRALDLPEDADVALLPYPAAPSLSEEIADALGNVSVTSLWPGLPGQGALRRIESWVRELPVGHPLLVPPVLVDIH